MAIASQLPHIFLSLHPLIHLFKSLRGLVPRALRPILRQLAFTWSILRTKLSFRQKGIGKRPSSQDDESGISKAPKDSTQSKHREQANISWLESGSTSYTLIEQGERISLDVAFSVSSFPGNIRATRSTHSLANSHPSAHNLAITINNVFPSSQHLGLQHSYHSGNLSSLKRRFTQVQLTATSGFRVGVKCFVEAPAPRHLALINPSEFPPLSGDP